MTIPDLSVDVGGLKLATPFMNASGILGVASSSFARLAKSGAGAVVTKSIGPRPRFGNPNPSVVQVSPGTFLNAVGLANPGVDEFLREFPSVKACGVPVVASVFGDSVESYAEVAAKFEQAGADAVELNVSCPHAEVSDVGTDPSRTREVVRAVRAAIKIPLWVKLSPNVTDVAAIATAAEGAGADAVVAINTVRAMAIDADLQRPVLFHGTGGLSGRAIKHVALAAVYQLASAVDVPVIGCGGVSNWRDAIEFFLAGASALQVGSALAGDHDALSKMAAGVKNYLEARGASGVRDLVGLARKNHERGAGGETP